MTITMLATGTTGRWNAATASLRSAIAAADHPLASQHAQDAEWMLLINGRPTTAWANRLAAIAVIAATTFAYGVFLRDYLASDMFLAAVGLAVAGIPEGLPAIMTITLAIGVRRMATRNAIIRRLPAVETLGSVSVICTDKTGTLTENRMLVERLWTPHGEYRISGDGYAPDGELTPSAGDDALVRQAAHIAAACNDATLVPPDGGGEWAITGDPTEGALVAFAAKLGVVQKEVHVYCPRVAEIFLARVEAVSGEIYALREYRRDGLDPDLELIESPRLLH